MLKRKTYTMRRKIVVGNRHDLMTSIGSEVLEHMQNKNIVKVTIHPLKDNKRTHTGNRYYEIIASYKYEEVKE